MGYPLGKAPTQVGTAPWPEEMPLMEGTSSADMRRIIGAMYENSGVVPNGGLTVEGTSSMAYKVNHGVAFMFDSVSSGLGRLAPVDTVTVNTAPAPSTGSRTDTIYVDSDGVVRVHEGTNPPHGIVVGQFVVPAGITSTNNAQRAINRTYAIPVGSSLGQLATWEAPSGPGPSSSSRTTRYSTRFQVPTDRLVRVDLTATLRTIDSDNGHVGFGVSIDSGFSRALSCYMWNAWRTYSGTWTTVVPAGTHTISVWSNDNMGAGWETATGTSTTQMNLWDAGVAR